MAAVFWTSGSGNWSVASNWSSNTVPTSTDDVTINATGTYTVTVDGTDLVNSLIFNAPDAIISIEASHKLDAESATITGGRIDGPGTLYDYPNGVWTIVAGTPLTLGGGLNWDVYSGTDVVNDAGIIDIGDTAGLNATIQNNGTFNLTTYTAGIGLNTVNVGGSSQSGIGNFENFGKLAKTGGSGTSHIFSSYTVSSGLASISVSTGTLEFDGPSNTF
jgi:hypothetical protein